jgi:hypothetical protein
MDMKKTFRFEYRRKPSECLDGSPIEGEFSLCMTQDDFEDYQTQKGLVHQHLESLGLSKDESGGKSIYWFESPSCDDALLEKLKSAFNAKVDSQLIPKYAHSWHYRHYRSVIVDSVMYRCAEYQGGDFIKFAPELLEPLDDSPIQPIDTFQLMIAGVHHNKVPARAC